MNRIIYKIFIIIFVSCGNQQSKDQIEIVEYKPIINESVFYYPKAYDKYWFTNQPNLEDSQGWIKPACGQKNRNKDSIKVKIKSQYLTHKGWGNYKGELIGINLETKAEIMLDFKCYLPDYNTGQWLGMRK